MNPNVIEVDHVSKMFTVHRDKSIKERLVNSVRRSQQSSNYWALKDVSLSVQAGESLGLAGPNGSGKSTLLKTIGGILTPNKGQVRTRGRLAALLELGAGFHPDLTGRENIFLNGSIMGLSESEIKRHLDAIIDFSGIPDFIDTQVKFYSSGMYVRLAFAVAVHSDPDILLVDEVLAVGDELFQRKCIEKIKEFQREGRSIILVSHSADQIIDVCDRAVILNKGSLVMEGEVREAMSFLHKTYRRQQLSEENGEKEEQRQKIIVPGSAANANMWIKNIHMGGGATEEAAGFASMPSGAKLSLQLNTVADAPISGYSIEVKFSTLQDKPICIIDSAQSSWNLPAIEGRWRFTINIPQLYLGAGDYSVGVTLRSAAGKVLDERPQAMMLSVQSSDAGVSGYVGANPEVVVEEWD